MLGLTYSSRYLDGDVRVHCWEADDMQAWLSFSAERDYNISLYALSYVAGKLFLSFSQLFSHFFTLASVDCRGIRVKKDSAGLLR